MIELGKTQCLNIVKVTDFGVYLGTEEDKVLLPKKQVPDDVEVGDALTVFVYRDSSDRLIATTNKPKIQLGELKRLKVSQVTGIGAFLDWGQMANDGVISSNLRCAGMKHLCDKIAGPVRL